ncbi:hypothetical protein BJ508DRAFT_311022 [Ascobolus immersus RN42]|uniref:Uncharacterized protein n=1 Tax=Ascobolus immersus RN42 TaxID=1160509 RepID=A0A3N4I3S8_ASCIM|nr:hypothetical protein BJ508DRAFT_311022 [Ascobolus immersus RN42]
MRPTFVTLPHELRLEIFRHIEKSSDAFTFPNIDRINQIVISEQIFGRYFLSVQEEEIIDACIRCQGLMLRAFRLAEPPFPFHELSLCFQKLHDVTLSRSELLKVQRQALKFVALCVAVETKYRDYNPEIDRIYCEQMVTACIEDIAFVGDSYDPSTDTIHFGDGTSMESVSSTIQTYFTLMKKFVFNRGPEFWHCDEDPFYKFPVTLAVNDVITACFAPQLRAFSRIRKDVAEEVASDDGREQDETAGGAEVEEGEDDDAGSVGSYQSWHTDRYVGTAEVDIDMFVREGFWTAMLQMIETSVTLRRASTLFANKVREESRQLKALRGTNISCPSILFPCTWRINWYYNVGRAEKADRRVAITMRHPEHLDNPQTTSNMGPTFCTLPYEIRIEIFKQSASAIDAVRFQNLDEINKAIITPRIYSLNFVTVEEEELLNLWLSCPDYIFDLIKLTDLDWNVCFIWFIQLRGCPPARRSAQLEVQRKALKYLQYVVGYDTKFRDGGREEDAFVCSRTVDVVVSRLKIIGEGYNSLTDSYSVESCAPIEKASSKVYNVFASLQNLLYSYGLDDDYRFNDDFVVVPVARVLEDLIGSRIAPQLRAFIKIKRTFGARTSSSEGEIDVAVVETVTVDNIPMGDSQGCLAEVDFDCFVRQGYLKSMERMVHTAWTLRKAYSFFGNVFLTSVRCGGILIGSASISSVVLIEGVFEVFNVQLENDACERNEKAGIQREALQILEIELAKDLSFEFIQPNEAFHRCREVNESIYSSFDIYGEADYDETTQRYTISDTIVIPNLVIKVLEIVELYQDFVFRDGPDCWKDTAILYKTHFFKALTNTICEALLPRLHDFVEIPNGFSAWDTVPAVAGIVLPGGQEVVEEVQTEWVFSVNGSQEATAELVSENGRIPDETEHDVVEESQGYAGEGDEQENEFKDGYEEEETGSEGIPDENGALAEDGDEEEESDDEENDEDEESDSEDEEPPLKVNPLQCYSQGHYAAMMNMIDTVKMVQKAHELFASKAVKEEGC